MPSTLPASRGFLSPESVETGPLGVPFSPGFPGLVSPEGVVPPCAAHPSLRSRLGDGPADASARRHAEPEGVPAAPLPSASLPEKSSETDEGAVPQFVPRLALVGVPGSASAVEQVDAKVGSSTQPTPAAPAANDPVAVPTAFARTRDCEMETLLWLVSASAFGPDVVGVGADPSGAAGSGSDADAVVGTVAVVPGPLADVVPLEGPVEPEVFVLDAVIGSLDVKVAGPASPPLAEADPPTVDPSAPG